MVTNFLPLTRAVNRIRAKAEVFQNDFPFIQEYFLIVLHSTTG